MVDGEHGIALPTIQVNRSSSRGEGEVSWIIWSGSGDPGDILELRWGWRLKTRACSETSGLLFSYEGHLRNLHEAWRGNTDAS